MARGVAQQTLELKGIVEQFRIFLALRLEPRLHCERVNERKIAALLGCRIELDDTVGFREREAQHAAYVANRLFALDRTERDYLGDAVVAVLAAHVAEHFVAPLEAEVDVNIGHRAASGIEPAFEQQ